jgi:FMN reductase
MPSRKPFIVGVGGTTRAESSTEQALKFALRRAEALGAETELLVGRDIELPMYDGRPESMTVPSRHLVESIRRADGVIFASPCYHGGVSGLIKNAIDYIEELRGDERTYLDRRAVGIIASGAGYQGPCTVLAQLRQTAHALRGWPVPLGVVINSAVVKFDTAGCSETSISRQIEIMTGQVVEFAGMQLASSELAHAAMADMAGRQHLETSGA